MYNAFYGFGYLGAQFCKQELVIRVRCGAYHEVGWLGEPGHGVEVYEVSEVLGELEALSFYLIGMQTRLQNYTIGTKTGNPV